MERSIAVLFIGALTGGCVREHEVAPRPECVDAAECGHGDPCTIDLCVDGKCTEEARTGFVSNGFDGDCKSVRCGPEGALVVADPGDADSDSDTCTVDRCDDTGWTVHERVADGDPCDGAEGVCLGTGCAACATPVCDGSDEGGSVDTAAAYAEESADCGAVAAGSARWLAVDVYDGYGLDLLDTHFFSESALRVCVYGRCTGGGPALATCDGGEAHAPDSDPDAPVGAFGCCWTPEASQATTLVFEFECDGIDDSGTAWMRVDGATDTACAGFALWAEY